MTPTGHTVDYCTEHNKKIKYSQQFPGSPCPHCETILPQKGEVLDPNKPPPLPIQTSTTSSIPGYRIAKTHGIVFVQQANRWQGLGTSGFDNKQAKKTTKRLLDIHLPDEVGKTGGNAVVGVKIDVHDTFTIVYGTAVTVEPD